VISWTEEYFASSLCPIITTRTLKDQRSYAPAVPHACKTTHRTKTTRLNICSLRRRRRSRSFSSSRRCRPQPTPLPTANPHVACRPRSLAVACCMRCLPACPSAHLSGTVMPQPIHVRSAVSPAGRPANARISLSIGRASDDGRATPGPGPRRIKVGENDPAGLSSRARQGRDGRKHEGVKAHMRMSTQPGVTPSPRRSPPSGRPPPRRDVPVDAHSPPQARPVRSHFSAR